MVPQHRRGMEALDTAPSISDIPWPRPQAEALEVSALTVVIQVTEGQEPHSRGGIGYG